MLHKISNLQFLYFLLIAFVGDKIWISYDFG